MIEPNKKKYLHLSNIHKLHICNVKKGTEDMMFFYNTLSKIISSKIIISELTVDFNLDTRNEKITFVCFLLRFKNSLKSLTFGNEFNHRLCNMLNILINLKSLTFGDNFCNGYKINRDDDYNKDGELEDDIKDSLEPPIPLGNSLYGLKKLETLVFGKKFNISWQ